MRNRRLPLLLSCLAAVACGDDVSSADGGGSNSSTSDGPTTSGPPTDDTTSGSTGSSSGAPDSSSTAADSSTGVDASGSGSESSGSSSDSTSGSSSSGDTTGGSIEACEEGGQAVLTWFLQVPGGVFPDDIPADLDTSCTFTPSATPGELPLDCADVDLVVTIESDPPVVLPAEGQSVGVRLHRQPGPLGFPDFWLELSFAEGRAFTLINSSVLVPSNDTVELPFEMELGDQDCGPFNIGTPFEPKDPCGDQTWLGLELALDDPLTVFHGTYDSGTSAGDDVGVWVGTARDYGLLPKFCDIAPAYFSAMVVSG